jgi:hypothetical protein
MATLCNIVCGNTLQYLGSPDTNDMVWGWWTYWRDKLWEQTPLLSHSAHLQQELGRSPGSHAAKDFYVECFRLLMYWSLRERKVGYLCFVLADSHTTHVIPNFDLSLGQAWLWLESHLACAACLLANDNSVLNLIRNAVEYFDQVIFSVARLFFRFYKRGTNRTSTLMESQRLNM